MEKQRVQKFIAFSGLCSRRKVEELISQGRVKVNGQIVKLGDKCLESDKIEVDSKVIKFNLKENLYIILNKPKGLLSTKSDELGRATIFDLISEEKENLFSVGRLDKETTGLLILTNDGNLTQRIIHPSKKIEKEYQVGLNEKLKKEDQKTIEKGLILDEFQLSPCTIKHITINQYTIKISEGRKRQIRRIFEQRNYKVLSLNRKKIGKLDLEKLKLKVGEYEIVTREFLEKEIFG